MSRYDKLDDEPERTDTEITLGLRSILGIFFGLVLICGVFFGFGYSLGRSNAVKPSAAPPVNVSSQSTTASPAPLTTVVEQSASSKTNDPYDFNANNSSQTKPSGAVLQTVAPATPSAQASDPANSTPSGLAPSKITPPAGASSGTQNARAPQTTPTSYTITRPAKNVPAPPSTDTAASTPSSIMVQVAAISRPQDADVLISALQKRGFNATARRETSDNLLHIQIGPFTTRQQAQMMRSRLINDGYNAILK